MARPENGDDGMVCGRNWARPLTLLVARFCIPQRSSRPEESAMGLTLRLCLLAAALIVSAPAFAQGTAADYERAEGLRTKYFGLVEGIADESVFAEDSKTLVYRRSLKGGGSQFIEVDLATLTKKLAFDHTALAKGLAFAAVRPYGGANLPFARYTLSADRGSMEFDLTGFK